MAGFVRGSGYGLLALFLVVTAAPAIFCCPFCSMQGQTLLGEMDQASMVLYGTLSNTDPTPKADAPDGTTDLKVEMIIKGHDILKKVMTKGQVLTLNRPVPLANDGKYKFLVFCDVFKGRVDPYRGMAVLADSDMPRYLKGAAEHKSSSVDKRLRFFFDYLDNVDPEVSNDAYKEFANADYKDYRDMAKDLPADKIAGWLRDSRTPAFRLGLYASMLGHCGKEEHVSLLRHLLDDPEKKTATGVDGILAGYLLLKPKEGWQYLNGILGDARREFMQRYAALRTLRFFWDYRSDVVSKKDLMEGVARLLEQKDITDLAIEDLRKWQCWDLTDRILSLCNKEAYEIPIVRRAILRFCLGSPKPEAARYVEQQRKKDAQGVADAEELLKLEQPAPAAPKNK